MGINCEFSIETLEDKLTNRLDKTQESVQELSRWLIKNHQEGDIIVKTWLKCLRQASSSSKKKSLIYLANDVLQNGIKKNTSYTDYFLPRLPIAFASFGICDQRLLKSLMHVLLVWETRNVFTPEYVKALRGALFAEQRKHLQQCIQEQTIQAINEGSLLAETSYNVDGPQTPPDNDLDDNESGECIVTTTREQNLPSTKKGKKRKKDKTRKSKKLKRRKHHEELGPRPEPKINLQKLELDVIQLAEEAASTDQKTREKLAQLPNEVQDESIMDALTDANTLELLYELVSRATSMVSQYTRRVKEEQSFRQALWQTMKIAKKEQTDIFKYQRKELQNNRRIIEVFSQILDKLEEEET